jgi:hypothetical protein
MSKINYNIGLCGEFRMTVLSGKAVVSDTGWCKNTILSSGLAYLADNSFLDGLGFIDFGTSSSDSNNFNLSGVVALCEDTGLYNIPSNNIQYYPLDKSTQVYYSSYSSPILTLKQEKISEFSIKTKNGTSFSRAVLLSSVDVNVGQSVNFEYRVSVDYKNEIVSSVEFTTPDATSFYIPVTSRVYNLPNFNSVQGRVGRLVDSYPLVLLQNNEELPVFGTKYPDAEVYAVGASQQQSTFTPTIVYSDIDLDSKSYSVITEYKNLSAPLNGGIFDNINTALLKYGDTGFFVSRFRYPLAVYNSTLYSNQSVVNSSNLLSLYYKYTWSETLTSTFLTPTTFSLSAPQLIPCNINLNVDLLPEDFITINSSSLTAPNAPGNTSIIRVTLLSSYLYNIIVNYASPEIETEPYPYGPSPYKIVVYDNTGSVLKTTDYVFPNIERSWPYSNTPRTSLNYYNDRLQRLANEVVIGSTPGTTSVERISVDASKNFVDILVNSPFIGTSWALNLSATAALILPVLEITLTQNISGISYIDDGSINIIRIPCNPITRSGSMGVTAIPVEFGSGIGWFGISHQTTNIPVKFDVQWNENTYTTKYVGSDAFNVDLNSIGIAPSSIDTADNGTKIFYIYKGEMYPSSAEITITSPLPNSKWEISTICPNTSDPTGDISSKLIRYHFGNGIPLSGGSEISDVNGLWLREGWVNDKPYYTSYLLSGALLWSNSSWNISVGNKLLFTSIEDTNDIDSIALWKNEGSDYTIRIDRGYFVDTDRILIGPIAIDDGTMFAEEVVTINQRMTNIGNTQDGLLDSSTNLMITVGTISNISQVQDGIIISSAIRTSAPIRSSVIVPNTDQGICVSGEFTTISDNITSNINVENGTLSPVDLIIIVSPVNRIGNIQDGNLKSEFIEPERGIWTVRYLTNTNIDGFTISTSPPGETTIYWTNIDNVVLPSGDTTSFSYTI